MAAIQQQQQHTNSHDNQETGQEPAKLDDAARAIVHEIIVIGSSSADPVWYGGENVGCDDEEGKVVLP